MLARTLPVPIAFVVCLGWAAGCTSTTSTTPSSSSAIASPSAPSSLSPSASASKSVSQVAAEDTAVKAYSMLWRFIALQTPSRDIEAEFSPYMRNVRSNGTEGFLAQSEKYANGILNGGVVAGGVPRFTIQDSRDATPLEGRPTVYVRACADLSTITMKAYDTGATLTPIDPSKDPRVFTVEQFSDGWRVVESAPSQNVSPC
jgi:hypothetical protein